VRAMKSIGQCKQTVKPAGTGRHKGETNRSQERERLGLSLINEWNSLFPDDPITEKDLSNIDLIIPRNSSSPTEATSPETLKDHFRALYLADYYSTFYGTDEDGFLLPEVEKALIGQQGDNSSRTEKISGELSNEAQGDNSSRTGESLGSSPAGQGDISSSNLTSSLSRAQGDNSSSTENPSGLDEFVPPSWSEEELRQFAEEWSLKYGVVESAYRKLQKFPECGKHGGVMVGYDYEKDEVADLILNPISCNSIHCPYCLWRHSRSRLSELISYFAEELKNGTLLTFITLTVPSTHDIGEATKLSKRLIERLYQFRFRGKSVQKRLRRLFIEELVSYSISLFTEKYPVPVDPLEEAILREELFPLMEKYVSYAEERSPEAFKELRAFFYAELITSSLSCYVRSDWQDRAFKVFRQLYFYSDFCFRLSDVSPDLKLGQYLSAVWKFELTYSHEHGYHPHWHGITTFAVPKLYLTAICRYIGFGKVSDIRQVKGLKGLVELAKYETKPWEFPMDDPVEVLKREAFLHGFKKLRVWNMTPREDERELPNVLYFAIPRSICTYTLLDRSSLRSLPGLYRELKEKALGGSEVVRERFGRVKLSATLGVGFASAYSDVYVGLDGDLHIPLDGKARINGEVSTIKTLAHKVLREYEFFTLRVVGYSLEDLVAKRLERLKSKSRKAEAVSEPQPVSSSLSSSSLSSVYEARAVMLDFLEEFQRYAGTLTRHSSYKELIDDLFGFPVYWTDREKLPEVAELLLSYGDRLEEFRRELQGSDLPEARETYEVLSYLVGKIKTELETILEESL